MLTPEELRALLLLSLNSKTRIDHLVTLTVDTLCMLEPMFERCNDPQCQAPATVKHVTRNVKLCDRHVAELACRSSHGTQIDPTELVDHWIDLPDATRIRRIVEFIDVVRCQEEPEPPSNPSQLH